MFRYTPTISRQSTRTFTTSPRAFVKVIPEAIQTTPGKQPENMAKKANEKASEITGEINDKPVPNKDGAIGKELKKDGAISGIGEKIGGAFVSDDAIGKNFNPDGAVGKTVNEKLGKK